jgi:hypothetical protein
MSSPSISSDLPSETAAGLATPVVRAVAEDLEAIFPDAAAPRGATAARLRLGGRPPDRACGPRLTERRAATLGGLLAAMCLGLSAGALIVRPEAPDAAPASPPALGPLAPAEPGVLTRAAVPTPPAAPRAMRLAPMDSQAVRPVSARRPAMAHRKPVRRASSLMAADARLRRAYASAERAGVAQPILVDYHDEWDSLRDRAAREPGVVTARYGQMAKDLNRLAAQETAEPAEAPRPGPWRRFRMQLAALWR